MSAQPSVVAVTVEHREGWHRLFADYCMGGGGEAGPEHLATVWGWLMSPAAQTRGLVALADGLPAGLANYRVFERPITGTTGVWIDDLFVDRAYRRRGLARALVEGVRLVAREEGHDVVRWTTRRSNTDARRLYDRIATEAPVVVYNATPGSAQRVGRIDPTEPCDHSEVPIG
ncbi:MAG: hypothetical protein BGO37_12140 [Cellulomonas sp. 73-92]|uniref:GNAT family N-acetyltransferase n=1 Tax=Cellulomonas sp. 73-92 TaxID=1895740 RepID=UPI0009268FB7|nr:GNAT family N-acetyltransferase [Cellulomonas sp. 73-92]OJV79690.1 MAG: hypothetical protein BGO37_12140 [Cellulomonas sp. 73-92]